jgi:phage I-like protein
MVDQAVADGKLAPAQKDWAIKAGKRDLGELQNFLGSAPAFPGGATVKGDPKPEKGKLTEEEVVICSALGLTHEAYLKSRDEGVL